MTPGTARVEPTDDRVGSPENRVGGAEDGLERLPRARHAGGERVGDVVVPGHGERRYLEPVEQRLRLIELLRPAAVR
jgi:hypothetical protein